MTDREFTAEKKRVTAAIRHWHQRLLLTNFDLHLEFDRTGEQMLGDACMMIHPNWKYMRAAIRINPRDTASLTDERLDWVVLHELGHLIVNEMTPAGDADDHEERICTMIANAIYFSTFGHMPND